MKPGLSSAVGFVMALAVCGPIYAQEPIPFDHLHLAVPEISQARDWYLKNMGGNAGETADQVGFGKWTGDHPLPIQLVFSVSANALPSAGSVIDSIGFSFDDLDLKIRDLQAAGVKVVAPVTQGTGFWRRAVIEDPWGTRIELVEDPDLLGLHHLTLLVRNPEASLAWYVRAFGGDRTTIKGRDAIRYRDLSVFYLFALKSDGTVPSQGHSIDDIGWGPLNLDQVVNDLKTLGVTFSSNPNPRGYPSCTFVGGDAEEGGGARALRRLYCTQPDQLSHRAVFLDAPDGVRVELLQHLEAGGH